MYRKKRSLHGPQPKHKKIQTVRIFAHRRRLSSKERRQSPFHNSPGCLKTPPLPGGEMPLFSFFLKKKEICE